MLGAKDYIADLRVDGMLHGALVLSEHPRAKVVQIDPAPALAMPGVVRVLTAADVPGERFVGLIVKDWPLFIAPGETTRCVGDVLAMVVADSEFHARRAAAAVAVDYEVLEPVTDPEAALAPGAPAIHPKGNLLETCQFARGDVDGALAASAHVFERTFVTQRIEHAFLEPEACLAVPPPADAPDAANAPLKVYSQGQGVHDDQLQIAAILGVETERIEVELVTCGGAFGGKEDLSIQGHTALAATLLDRPVRTVLTREQSLRLHPKRHPITLHYVVGADADGKLTAVRARIVGDTGAYASVGMKVLERAAGHSCGAYHVPAVDVVAKTVYTNNPPSGAMRGFGANQAAFAIEGMLDLVAEAVGIDGYDVRERNVLGPGDRFATGQLMTGSCGVRRTLEAVRDAYKGARYAGIACGIKNTGIGNGMEDGARVLLRVLPGGRLAVETGYTEMGQGLFTVLRQVVCEETGIAPERMEVKTLSDAAALLRHDHRLAGHRPGHRGGAGGGAQAGRRAERRGPRQPRRPRVPRRVHLRLHHQARRQGREPGHPPDLRLRHPGGDPRRRGAPRAGGGGPRRRPGDQPPALRRPDRGVDPHGARLRAVGGLPLHRRPARLAAAARPRHLEGQAHPADGRHPGRGPRRARRLRLQGGGRDRPGAHRRRGGGRPPRLRRRAPHPAADDRRPGGGAVGAQVAPRRRGLMTTLAPIPFPDLVRRMRAEAARAEAIFDLPRKKWFAPGEGRAGHDFSAVHFGRRASTPVGPAAGPHTQLAQNIVLAWLAGSRILELKTVQVNDRLEIPRPCIHAPNVGYNVEWSQELTVAESLREYAKAAYLIEILKATGAFGLLGEGGGGLAAAPPPTPPASTPSSTSASATTSTASAPRR